MKKVLRVLLGVTILLALLYGVAMADQGGSISFDDRTPVDKVSFVSWMYGPGSSTFSVSGTKVKWNWTADSSYQQTGYVIHLNKRSSTKQSSPLGFYTTGDDGYYYIPTKLLKTTSSTGATIDLKSKGTYYLTVYSYYSSPSSYMSSRCRIVKVNITASGTALGKPTGVKAKQTGAKKVQLTWKAAANAKSYAVYRATGSGSFKKIGTTKKLKYVDSKVKKGTTYKYKIQAIKGSKKVFSSVVKITIPRSTGSVTYRAILLANTYASGSNPLPMCEDDRYAMAKMFENLGATSYTVTSKKNADAAGMESAIRSVFSQADDDDVTVLYYTGHGANSPYNAEYQGALCGNDENSYISASQLRNILDQYKGTKIILLNSCHSGAVIGKGGNADAKSVARQINSSFIQAFYSPVNKANLASSGYYVLAACKSEQVGIGITVSNGDRYSIFTRALVDGLGWNMLGKTKYSKLNADSNGDNKVTFAECYKYTKKGVDQMEADFNSRYGWDIAMDVQVYPTNCSEVFFAR